MNILFTFVFEAIALLAGVALVLYAKPLAVRFNTETPAPPTPHRPRKSRPTKRPPSPPLDPKTLTILFRIAGTFLILGTLLPLLAIALTRHR